MSNLLNNVERPGRYIGGEIGAVVKNENDVTLRVVLAFPDVYEIAMSHIGLKIIYGMINQRSEYWAERVMAPWLDLEANLRREGRPLTSLESGRPLSEFDVVGFSLQYELSYTGILNMLDLGGVPLLASERGQSDPIVIGGGPGAYNPEPMADFFDLFWLGDAEAGFMELLDEIAAWKKTGASRIELFERLAGRPGVYVPSFFQPIYDPDGRIEEIRPLRPGYTRVEKAVLADLDASYFPDRIVCPSTKPVHDRVSVEISRGCTRGCRFCQAGFVYRPVRERGPSTVLDLMDRIIASTGHEEAAFLSLSAGDYSGLQGLMCAFMDTYSQKYVSLSLPSLRVKSLTPEIMRQIKRVRKTGFTLAPEAGTARLREVINKDLTEEDLLDAARQAFSLGWRLIKLYFMVGLPTETIEDVEAIADLAARVKAGTRGKVNVSFAAFVPKPQTPFQWEPMLDLAGIRARMDLLREKLRRPGLKPKWNQAEASVIEGILARGDRRLGPAIRKIHARGGRFEAWTEKLDYPLWLSVMAEEGLDPRDYLRARDKDEVLPWSHLSPGPTAEYLWAERERAYQGLPTADCRDGLCGDCGVCDFESIHPRIGSPEDPITVRPLPEPPAGERVRLRVNYAKTSMARYLSHLETVDVFVRAVRRAGLNFHMSQGFNPHPKINFDTPLSVGVHGEDEWLTMDLVGPPPASEVAERLAVGLPAGFRVKSAVEVVPNAPKPRVVGARYLLTVPRDVFEAGKAEARLALDRLPLAKKGKKGVREVDLKEFLGEIKVLTPGSIELTLRSGPEGAVRPEQAARELFELEPQQLDGAEIRKLTTIFSEE